MVEIGEEKVTLYLYIVFGVGIRLVGDEVYWANGVGWVGDFGWWEWVLVWVWVFQGWVSVVPVGIPLL